MSINAFTDPKLSPNDVVSLLDRPGKKRLAISTVCRWMLKGVKGIRLESIRIGRALYTTEAALNEFFAACAAAPAERKPREELKPVTSTQRRKQIARAEARLSAAGI